MKRTAFLSSIIALIVVCVFSSCQKDDYLDWKYLNESWLEEHKNDSGWVTTASGLQYKMNQDGIFQDSPNDKSIVFVEWSSWYINGDTIAHMGILQGIMSSSTFVPGVREGLKMMKQNAVYEFRVPYGLGRGKDGYGDIPPYTTLNYKIKLISFMSYNPNDY